MPISEYFREHFRAIDVHYFTTDSPLRSKNLRQSSKSTYYIDSDDQHRSIHMPRSYHVPAQSCYPSGCQGSQLEGSKMSESDKLHRRRIGSNIVPRTNTGFLQYSRGLLSNRDLLLLCSNDCHADCTMFSHKEATENWN